MSDQAGDDDAAGGLSRRGFLRATVAFGTLATVPAPLARATTESWDQGDLECQPNVQPVKEPAYPIDAPLLRTFTSLSESLTGVSPLDPHLASEYLDRYARHPQLTALLPPLVQAFRSISPTGRPPPPADVQKTIIDDPKLRPAAEQVIYVWYVSAFFLPRADDPKTSIWVYGSPESYGRGLLWSLIRAHAPMTHGGPYGYWADAPSM